ncbi:Vesicle coat complex COPI, gamma subunit, partial [Pseudoloma neurophilia]
KGPQGSNVKVKLAYSDNLPENISLNDTIRDKIFKTLTEYIEDCPHPVILRDIFGLIDDKKYKINVYNRLLLEQESVRNCAILSLDRMNSKFDPQIDESDDDLMSFYLKNRSRSKKSAIQTFVNEHIEVTEKKLNFIKTSKPKILLEKELKVVIHKKIYKNYYYVVFSLQNTTKELEIQDCKLHVRVENSFLKNNNIKPENISQKLSEQRGKSGELIYECDGSKFELIIDSITSLQTKTIVIKRKRVDSEEIFNVNCDFELKDKISGESETENRICKEFDVTIIDFIRSNDQEIGEIQKNTTYEKSISFALENKSVFSAKDYILEVIDMRTNDQKQTGDTLLFSLTGEFIDFKQNILPIGFDFKLEHMGGDVATFVKISGDQKVVDQVANILQ